MRILIAFASKRGGTGGLANMIGDELRDAGYQPVISPAAGIYDLTEFDAVILASALYGNRWLHDAKRFARRNAAALSELPVWLVSSGPLNGSAESEDIAPTKRVAKLMNRIGARGHVTFGGRLAADASGFPASAMAKTRAGDWRDRDHVKRWAKSVVAALEAAENPAPQT